MRLLSHLLPDFLLNLGVYTADMSAKRLEIEMSAFSFQCVCRYAASPLTSTSVFDVYSTERDRQMYCRQADNTPFGEALSDVEMSMTLGKAP